MCKSRDSSEKTQNFLSAMVLRFLAPGFCYWASGAWLGRAAISTMLLMGKLQSLAKNIFFPQFPGS